jgi:hypothetical protein
LFLWGALQGKLHCHLPFHLNSDRVAGDFAFVRHGVSVKINAETELISRDFAVLDRRGSHGRFHRTSYFLSLHLKDECNRHLIAAVGRAHHTFPTAVKICRKGNSNGTQLRQ